jgi:hypothetical protein
LLPADFQPNRPPVDCWPNDPKAPPPLFICVDVVPKAPALLVAACAKGDMYCALLSERVD